MQTHPFATELNKQIQNSSPNVYACLSETGKQIFFPAGILKQSGEAKQKATRFNATIGIAVENGEPMYLEPTRKYFSGLSLNDIYAYAPPDGIPELRTAWQDKIYRDNPSLVDKKISLPVVSAALTHGLSLSAEMFIDPGDVVIVPDKRWGAYSLMFETRNGARFSSFPLFNTDGGYNVQGLIDLMKKEAASHDKLVILFNTPNNPTGYTPSLSESQGIFNAVREQAEAGTRIVTLSDDAYFGLFYEDSIKESLFAGFCDLHENILAVKLDAATKESLVWGFRTGFITFGAVAKDQKMLYGALEQKLKGMVRGTISSSNHPSQEIVYRLLKDPAYEQSVAEKLEILKRRAARLKQILTDSRFDEDWCFYPFNSGYFMCLNLKRVNAEELRLHLLDKYQVGTIAIGQSDLRIAFSAVEEEDIEELVSRIHQGARDLS